GDEPAAKAYYKEAVEHARRAEQNRSLYGELASTRRNARLIIEHQGGATEWLDELLKIPRVVVFAGHMVDQPGRERPRLPSELVPQVRAAIAARLDALAAGFGYASAASGSDILFLELLLERGGEAHVILPFNKEQFMQTSVEVVPEGDWRARCEHVLAEATEVLVASEKQMHAEGMSYEYTNLLLQGLAAIKAGQLETELVALAVWDGRRGDGPGGTATAIEHWKDSKLRVELIELSSLVRQGRGAVETTAPEKRAAARAQAQPTMQAPEFRPQLKAMLFADAYHFSQLVENQIPIFYQHFMGRIGDLIRRTEYAPVMKKTWGDGLYFVFNTVREAGLFALELCAEINQTRWPDYGLPADLNLRIGLHAGPIYSCLDPVTNQRTYIGSHVTRTARIEPVTPPGLVYTSQSFAALAAQQSIRDFICEYVGRTPLPKGFGTIPAYLLRRARA
ncbi:MAG TPA: adenylate/guanylate cyclase domain-containing protein, partial [Pyrinomonadaceae bacterium]|nr:adenylate/guanylate cyclase domain-containing protein [Pyrinomonadaceae bacterium]